MSKNTNLHRAKNAKKDEFYTQMPDIEIEMNAYLEYDENVFRDKVIFCNCDDPYESNFFKYFALRFDDFGLKQLIATCYSGSPITGTQLSLFDEPDIEQPKRKAYKVIINEVKDLNGDGAVDLEDIKMLLANENNIATELEGNGDFRSPECVELLKQADIVVTNPPFSKFIEYVAQLVKYKKKFIIISNQNSITYKDIFPLIKDNKIWLGANRKGGTRAGNNLLFTVPDTYDSNFLVEYEGKTTMQISAKWLTNLPIKEREECLQLMTRADNLRFNKKLKKALNKLCVEDYPKYDNYDAIEIPITAAIPSDYKGVMGVPITFLDKYCPEQFEIIGADGFNYFPSIRRYKKKQKVVDGKRMKSLTGTLGCTIRAADFGKGTYFDVGYPVISTYKRLFIKYTDQWIKDHPQDFKEEI